MFSSFSSTSDGCDSCASLDQAYGGQIQNVNPMVNHYAQPNVLQNHANNVSPGSNVQYQNNNSRPSVPNVATIQPPQQSNNSQAQVAMNNMVQKVVAPKNNVVNTVVSNNQPQVQANNTEGFTVANSNQVQVNIPSRMILLNIGIVVLMALAINECSKYYINRAIQTSEGQPHYYLGYAVLVILLAIGVHYLSKHLV
jgi:hypothetical protein